MFIVFNVQDYLDTKISEEEEVVQGLSAQSDAEVSITTEEDTFSFEVPSLRLQRPPGPPLKEAAPCSEPPASFNEREVDVAPHQNEVEESPSNEYSEYRSRLRPRRSRPDWSREENEGGEVEKVKKAPVVKIKRKLEVKPSVEERRMTTGSLDCQICTEKFQEIRDLVLHSKSQHLGATFNCPFEGCQYSSRDIIQLRTHQYQLDHFLCDHSEASKVEESKSVENFQRNEKDIVGYRCPSCPYEARLDQFNYNADLAMEALFRHEENAHGTTLDQLKYNFLY